MSYNKRVWANGDLITKEKINHMENGIYDAHDKINAIDNELSSQIKDIENKINIKCSFIGMIPNDINESENNFIKLITYCKNNINIIVDDIYYIGNTNGIDNNINNLNIKGINTKECKFILNGGTIFTVINSANIKNLSIESIKHTIFIQLNIPKNIRIKILNCDISGNIRFISSNIPNSDYDYSNCYIDSFVLKNNEFKNIHCTNGNPSIIYLESVPVNYCDIIDNKVENFSYVFFHNGINNDNLYKEYIYENNKFLRIENNIVKNDYNYNPKNIYTNLPTYYCFSIVEGKKIVCKNNIFEGFIIQDAIDTVVYDNYFSVSELTYVNNNYRNIINLTSGIVYQDLFKSKAGNNNDYLLRHYIGNIYEIDSSLSDKFNCDKSLLVKELMVFQEWMDEIIIKDNIFNLYILSMQRINKIKNLYFINNKITCDTLENNQKHQAYLSINCYDPSIIRHYNFTNNNIFIKNDNTTDKSKTRGIINFAQGMDSTIDDYSNVYVLFENNNIIDHSLDYIVRDENLSTICNADILFNNNTIVSKNNKNYFYIITKNIQNIKSFENNIIETNNSEIGLFYDSRYESNLLSDLNIKLLKFKIKNFGGTQIFNILDLFSTVTNEYNIIFKIKRYGIALYDELEFNFKLRSNGTNNIIEGNIKDLKNGDSDFSSKEYILDGNGYNFNNALIKNNSSITTNTVNINICNTSTRKSVILHTPTSYIFTNDDIDIEIIINKLGTI